MQNFDLNAFASAFDAAQTADSSITSMRLSDSITQFLASTSDDAAYGGDLAYYYGTQGSFDGMSSDAARAVLKAGDFGQQQSLHSLQNMKQGGQLLSTGHP